MKMTTLSLTQKFPNVRFVLVDARARAVSSPTTKSGSSACAAAS